MSYVVFCANSTEEATTSIWLMMLSMSYFKRSRMVSPWMIFTMSPITQQRSFIRYFWSHLMWSRCRTSGTGWWYWPTWIPSTLFIPRLVLRLWEALLSAFYRRHHFLKNVILRHYYISFRSISLATQGRQFAGWEDHTGGYRDMEE